MFCLVFGLLLAFLLLFPEGTNPKLLLLFLILMLVLGAVEGVQLLMVVLESSFLEVCPRFGAGILGQNFWDRLFFI